MVKVLILYYSRNGSTKALADAIANGVELAGGEPLLRTVPAISTNNEKTEPNIPDSGDIYAEPADLADCDALALGSPTRFGNMAAPLKYFWDTTSTQWIKGCLVDKPAGVFCSSSSHHGGQETTLLSMMIPLLHHGMLITGIPYTEPALNRTTTGGTPYGATHVTGHDNNQTLSQDEQELATSMGKRLTKLAQNR